MLDEVIADFDLGQIDGASETMRAGLEQLQVELLRIGLDGVVASKKRVRVAKAAVDFDNYHYLSLFHAAIDDLLHMTLSQEHSRWAEQLMASFPPELFDAMTTLLVERAAHDDDGTKRSMWRILLFESIRIYLVVSYHHDPGLAHVGVDTEDLSVIAEDQMDRWLAAEPAVPRDVRPFRVIIAAALRALKHRYDEVLYVWAELQRECRERLDRRARLDAHLAHMDARDALLIRNYFAESIGERPLTLEVLRKRHPLIFEHGNRNADDKRLSRARTLLKHGQIKDLYRTRKSLLEIVGETTGQKLPRTAKEGQ